MKQKVNDELKQHFRPEFLNRIDDTIVFHQLQQAEIRNIVDIFISRIEGQLKNKDMGLELTDAAKTYLATKGYDPVLGARPLRRTIQRDLEDSLSEQILFNELRPGQIVVVDCEGDPDNVEKSKLTFTGADRETTIPDAVPADLGAATAEE
jgi:ATP-dependent Clp protease ATP-binding subunit ClpC